jgi:DNA-binding NarL/FixJ family response regulator
MSGRSSGARHIFLDRSEGGRRDSGVQPPLRAMGSVGRDDRRVAARLRIRVQANRRVVGEAVAAAIQDIAGLPVTTGSTDPTQADKVRYRPDVVVVIGSTFDGSTIAALRTARHRWRQAVLIALSDTSRLEDGVALIRQGADYWLSPNEGLDVLRSVIIRIASGERVLLNPATLAQIAEALSHPAASRAASRAQLTIRESQVLECFAQGLSRPDIAAMLGISTATLRTHVQNILRKLGLHSIDRAASLVVRPERKPAHEV